MIDVTAHATTATLTETVESETGLLYIDDVAKSARFPFMVLNLRDIANHRIPSRKRTGDAEKIGHEVAIATFTSGVD